MTRKRRVGVIFGGRSGEHEISLISARSIMRALDPARYEVVPIGIDTQGRWLVGGDPLQQLTAGTVPLPPSATALTTIEEARVLGTLDVVFPVLHGPFGEDGTIQGFLDLAGIPYVGAGVAASALGMDKALMKSAFVHAGLPVPAYAVVLRGEWQASPVAVRDGLIAALGLPVFVKPANLGSSVGINKAHDAAELDAFLAEAAEYDRKLIVEAAVPGARELECSVLGNDDPHASVVGEIVPHREFYDFEAKYTDASTELLIPAPVDAATAETVRELSLRAFKAIDCAGMARVDFLMERAGGRLWVSEINTIPGFTHISMYPKLWEASGLPYPDLLDRLIDLALERAADRSRNRVVRKGMGR